MLTRVSVVLLSGVGSNLSGCLDWYQDQKYIPEDTKKIISRNQKLQSAVSKHLRYQYVRDYHSY